MIVHAYTSAPLVELFVNGKSMLARDPSGNELMYGGALTILGGEVELVDCTFRDNVLGTDGGSFMSSPYYGGAIHATGGHVTMKRCTFLRCVSRKKMHATLLCGCDMPFLLICALAFGLVVTGLDSACWKQDQGGHLISTYGNQIKVAT